MAKRTFRKGVSLLLCATMLVSMLQVSVFAAGPAPECGVDAHSHSDGCYGTVGAHTHDEEEREGFSEQTCALEESEGTSHQVCTLEESEGAPGTVCGLEESEGALGAVCGLEESEGSPALICEKEEHSHDASCYPVELSENAKRLLKKQTTARARIYLLYENEVPGNINQSFSINKFGPQGDNTPYFTVTVDLEKLLEDGTVDVYWNRNDQWYISVQSGTTGQRYTAQSLWEKILDCMSASDQAKFDEFFHGMYIGYVLKDEAGRNSTEPHIDGVMVEEPPVYFVEMKINGDVVGTFLESGKGASYNNADGTHYADEILPKFEEELQALYGDVSIDWDAETFTDGRYVWSFDLTGNSVAKNGYPNYKEITRNIYYVAAYSLDVGRPVEIPAPKLSIDKSVDLDQAKIGDTLTYTISVTNTGTLAAENVTVTDLLDSRLTFVAASGDSYDPVSGVWSVGSLDALTGSAELTITAVINDSAQVGDEIGNVAVMDGTSDEVTTTVLPEEYTLTVNWVNQKGEPLADQLVIKRQEGFAYQTEQKEFDGYKFLQMAESSDPVSGTLDSDKVVTYVYAVKMTPIVPIVTHTLTVNWVNQKGEPLADQLVQTMQEGSPYETEQKNIRRYKFVGMAEDSDPVSGIMDSSKVVTYVYSPRSIPNPDPDIIPEDPDNPVDPEIPVDPEVPGAPVDPEVPGAPADPDPVDIPDEDIPLAELPAAPAAELPEGEVPLSGIPETGDPVLFYTAMAIMSGMGLAFVNRKPRDEED